MIIQIKQDDKQTLTFASATQALEHLLTLASKEWNTPYSFIRSVNDELISITGINYNLTQPKKDCEACS